MSDHARRKNQAIKKLKSKSWGYSPETIVLKRMFQPDIFLTVRSIFMCLGPSSLLPDFGVHEDFAFGWKTCHWNYSQKKRANISIHVYEYDAWSHDCGNKGVGMPENSSCGKRSAKDPYYSRKGLWSQRILNSKRDSCWNHSIGSIHPAVIKEILLEDQGILEPLEVGG